MWMEGTALGLTMLASWHRSTPSLKQATKVSVLSRDDLVRASRVCLVVARDVVVAGGVVVARDVVVAGGVVVARDVVVAGGVVVGRGVVVAGGVVVGRGVVVEKKK